MKSAIKHIVADLLRPPPDKPEHFGEVTWKVILADHLTAYRWAVAYTAGKDVLEIGVNQGYGCQMLAAEAKSFVGVELSYELAKEARNDTGLYILQADGMDLPLPENKVDVVVAFHVVEHTWDDQAFLKELHRVLRPGGLCVLSTPQRRYRLLYGQSPWSDWHLREYDEHALKELLLSVFGCVHIFGAFAENPPGIVEHWRVYQDPWQHYFGGPWGRPLRVLGRLLTRLMPSRETLSEQDIQRLAAKKPEDLSSFFYFDSEELEDAIDLLAICRKEEAQARGTSFNARQYWHSRLVAHLGLQGTGTSLAPEAWQRWLYRGKKRAYKRLFHRNRLILHGKRTLNFGCGTGYFEDVWEQWGAECADGIDFVPEVIETLARQHPWRRYLAADISECPASLEQFDPVFLLTAIDVLYHIVDDQRLMNTLRPLVARLARDGYFLFTDALREQKTAQHVRFRSLNQWRQILEKLGMEVLDTEPVFAFHNRLIRGVQRFPGTTGALQYFFDLPVLRTMPWLANNWAVLARWKASH